MDAVEGSFGVDTGLVAPVLKPVSVIVVWKCLPTLYFPTILLMALPISPASVKAPMLARDVMRAPLAARTGCSRRSIVCRGNPAG